MYYEDIQKTVNIAETKLAFMKRSKLKYLAASALAGIYVGFGILLIYTIGGLLASSASPAVRIVMGASFGIALSLVIMAGAELLTGNNMIISIGNLEKKVSIQDAVRIYSLNFTGNLLGSILLAILFYYGGLLQGTTAAFIIKTAQTKMSLPWTELLARGILCNMLVCLAIWCSLRLKEETGKLIMVFWCLFAFITTGFEHSVANMTLLATALLAPGAAGVSGLGFLYNITVVTIGNFLGALFIGGAYWYISSKH